MTRIRFAIGKGAVAILALVATPAGAQFTRSPNPADPGVAVPPTKYESPFAHYQPFREQNIGSWQEANKEVAENPGMGSMDSMKHEPGMPMPGMDAKAGDARKSKEGSVGHDMGSMKDDAMPGTPMPDMDKKAATAPSKRKESAGGHDMGSMADMPDKTKSGSSPSGKEAHGSMAMAKPNRAPGQAARTQAGSGITGTGVVQAIDKANGRVKLTHDPIAALGWPRMTVVFRLKDASLADQIKEGAKVEFSLEQSASGYVISGFQK